MTDHDDYLPPDQEDEDWDRDDEDDEGLAFDHDDYCECEKCVHDRSMDDCGYMPQLGSCSLAGTEHCDWDCPLSHESEFDDDDE